MRYTVKKIQELTGLSVNECKDIEANIFVDWSEASDKQILNAITEYQNMDALEAKMAALGL